MRALVWRSIKLFEKRGDHHHRSGEEEPLVERRREVMEVMERRENTSSTGLEVNLTTAVCVSVNKAN